MATLTAGGRPLNACSQEILSNGPVKESRPCGSAVPLSDTQANAYAGVIAVATDNLRVSVGARSSPSPLLHPWKGSSDALTARVHASERRRRRPPVAGVAFAIA
jgi:hypothetical protein